MLLGAILATACGVDGSAGLDSPPQPVFQALSEAPTWVNVVRATVLDGGSTLAATPKIRERWSAGASTAAQLSAGEGYAEFRCASGQLVAGLSAGDASPSYTEIDFGVYCANGTLYVQENGVSNSTIYGTYTNADIFRVEVASGVVRYLKNGATFYTSSVAPSYPLVLDTSLYSSTSRLEGARLVGLPRLVVDPGQITFAPTLVGATATQQLVVRNEGSGVLQATLLAPAPFGIVGSTLLSLGAGEAETLQVTFAPIQTGTAVGSLEISGLAGASIPLTGAVGPGGNPIPRVSFCGTEGLPPAGVGSSSVVTVDPEERLVDVLILYTQRAEDERGAAGIQQLANAIVQTANNHFDNSRVDMQMRLVGLQRVDGYVEEGWSLNREVGDLVEGRVPGAHGARTRYGADLVHLLVALGTDPSQDPLNPTPANCGLGHVFPRGWTGSQFAYLAYTASIQTEAVGCQPGAAVHEMAHNMGLGHGVYYYDRRNIRHGSEENPNEPGARFPYGYGWADPEGAFQTMMLGNTIPYFSNPDVSWNGTPTGTRESDPRPPQDGWADSARALNEARIDVVNFKARLTTPGECDGVPCREDFCGDLACDGDESTSCPSDCGCLAARDCNGVASAGCRCDAQCVTEGDCCPDACVACDACEPVDCGTISIAVWPSWSVVVGDTLRLEATGGFLSTSPVLWDLGNGTHLEGNPTTYVYPAAGDYLVRLTVSDLCGNTTIQSLGVSVQAALQCDPNQVPLPNQCGNCLCEPGAGETCTSCFADCQVCCGDGTCDGAQGETCSSCASDCGVCEPPPCEPRSCGNDCGWQGDDCGGVMWCGACEPDCVPRTCGGDCGFQWDGCGLLIFCGECDPCGDGSCEPYVEGCGNCPEDCPCPSGQECQADQCVVPPVCGDGSCNGTDQCWSCPEDCGACVYCGDGSCDWPEDGCSCSEDCGSYCIP